MRSKFEVHTLIRFICSDAFKLRRGVKLSLKTIKASVYSFPFFGINTVCFDFLRGESRVCFASLEPCQLVQSVQQAVQEAC